MKHDFTEQLKKAPRLASRPRDKRGYPIMYTALIDKNGDPDFRVVDFNKAHECVKKHLCGLCGQPMGRFVAFIGGPLSGQSHVFSDVGMHRDCATAAMNICPYMVLPKMDHAPDVRHDMPDETVLVPNKYATIVKPVVIGLYITKTYEGRQHNDGTFMIHTGHWEEIEWWKDGKHIPQEEAVNLMREYAESLRPKHDLDELKAKVTSEGEPEKESAA